MSLEFVTTRDQWLETCFNRSGSDNSRKMGIEMLKTYDKFNETLNKSEDEILDELKRIQKEPELYIYINNYVQYLVSNKLSRNSIINRLTFLKDYLRSQGIRIYSEDMKQFVKLPKRIHEARTPLMRDEIRLLRGNANQKLASLLLILSSSGMRINEVLQLTVSKLSQYCYRCDKTISLYGSCNCNTTKQVIEINIKASTTKYREERTAYMSREAFNELIPIIKDFERSDNLLLNEYDGFISLVQIETLFNKARKDAGLVQKYSNGRNYHINLQSFRAFFETHATKVLGGDIAHALIGHHSYLDQYFRLTRQERAEQYKTLEPYLKIKS